jgi:AAA family ATPase
MGVTVVAATNRPEVIVRLFAYFLSYSMCILSRVRQDAALMRPGRLDRILYVGPPDLKGREEILAIRTRGMSVEPGLNLQEIAELVRSMYSSAFE